jgi:shikimate dehydrogenase
MFAHQGAEQFQLWTGLEPPLDIMRRAVLEGLGEDDAD